MLDMGMSQNKGPQKWWFSCGFPLKPPESTVPSRKPGILAAVALRDVLS